MRRRTRTLVLLTALGGASACGPDESSVGGLFRPEPGLLAEYFDARSLQQPSGFYQDANIDFEGRQLNDLAQARGHAARALSIRWSGQLHFAHAETYTLGFELQGRVRLWIGDTLVIDDWTDSGALRRARGTIAVGPAGWRDLRIEWDQLDGPMTARLRYASPSQADTIVPAGALRQPEP
jgi:hypothetical protein